jgi:hypothetical protein
LQLHFKCTAFSGFRQPDYSSPISILERLAR